MRKGRLYLLCLLFVLSMSACGSITVANEYNNNSSTDKTSISNAGVSYQEVDTEKTNLDNIVALIDDSIIYSQYADNNSSIEYYKYDLNSKKSIKIGSIANPYIYSASTAQIGEKLYFYMNTTTGNGTSSTSLYEINCKNNTTKAIQSVQSDQTLIYVGVQNQNLLSFKGKIDGDTGITYIDTYNPLDDSQDKLISEKYNTQSKTGGVIYNFAQFQGDIYTVGVDITCNKKNYFIKKYDSTGQLINNIKLGKSVTDVLNNERISTFRIMGNYVFLRNFSGQGILCRISKKEVFAKIVCAGDFDIAFSTNKSTACNYSLLFQRDTCTLWLLDTTKDILEELDISFRDKYNSINFVGMNADKDMIISMQKENMNHENVFLLHYLDLPIIKSYSLSNQNILSF